MEVGLAILIVVGTALEAGFADAPAGARAAALGPAAIMAAAVLVRRRAPIAAVALGAMGLIAVSFVPRDVWSQLNILYFGHLFVVYSMAGREDGRRLRLGVVAGIVGVVTATLIEDARHPQGELVTELLGGGAFFVLAPVLAGRLLRSRVRLNDALAAKSALAAAGRSDAAREAVIAERVRIASELHDLVAHALGAMTVQASAARTLAGKDASRAAAAFEAIELTGRDALGELRTLLDVLRDDEDPAGAPTPQPTLEHIPRLVQRARDHGLEVAVTVEGERPDALPAGVELTAYRVVQDALRAARNEGGAAAAQVVLRYGAERLEVEVSDDGARVADRSLLGLQERVRLFGGDVARREGTLRASIPLERVSA